MTITPAKAKVLDDFPTYSYDASPDAVHPIHESELPGKPRLAIRIKQGA
mgnify:CR=1 FL=1